jgi:hypothetical protein
MKGGGSMGFFLSLVEIALKVVFKETFTALFKRKVSRNKERIAPMASRDDSDTTKV